MLRNNQGLGEEAIQLLEKGISLNPHYSWDYLYNLGRAHYALGQYEEAGVFLREALERNESPTYPRVFLIASLVQLNQLDDAEWEVEQLGMFHPEITVLQVQQNLPISDSNLMERLLVDLRKAGLE